MPDDGIEPEEEIAGEESCAEEESPLAVFIGFTAVSALALVGDPEGDGGCGGKEQGGVQPGEWRVDSLFGLPGKAFEHPDAEEEPDRQVLDDGVEGAEGEEEVRRHGWRVA